MNELMSASHARLDDSVNTGTTAYPAPPTPQTLPEQGIWREAQVARYTGLGRSSRWKLEKEGKFPKKIKLSVRATGHWAHEVIAWAQARPQALENAADPSSKSGNLVADRCLHAQYQAENLSGSARALGMTLYARAS